MEAPTNNLPLIPYNVVQTTGPLLLGHLLNWFLFGLLSLQIYIYYLSFPDDSLSSQALSYGVYLFELAQTIILTQAAFRVFAQGYGNLHILDEVGTNWLSAPIMGGIVAFVAQAFYARRIWILSKSIMVPLIILLLATISLAGAIALGVAAKLAASVGKFVGTESRVLSIVTGIWNGGSCLCDILIATSMTVYLTRRNSSIPRTRQLVKRIIRLTIETGTLTAVVALLNLILALLPNHPTYYRVVAGCLGKLYANSMMAVFNNRAHLWMDDRSGADSSIVFPSRYFNQDLEMDNLDGELQSKRTDTYIARGPVET
ncbi:hypothetical protein CPB83DRAFT_864613 [Crepidotus variabilis]|uniref:DUF6534 domain-containing protein n=1 Tax=Crepidotus variabilis TaxID=179855 RepID=A0A9P6E4H2_9AGAR|nr:hypothetical protein CPB83DRAFT_864613 [Crepidotus variabilis]